MATKVNQEDTISRRVVLGWITGAAIGAGVGKPLEMAISGLPALFDSLRSRGALSPSDYIDMLLPPEGAQLVPAMNHPLLIGTAGPYPSAVSALTACASYISRRHPRANLISVDQPMDMDWHQNIIAIGSETSNDISRTIMSEQQVPLMLVSEKDRGVKRYTAGREFSEGCVRVVESGKSYEADIDKSGFMVSDYLLITRIRNSYDRLRFCTIIGGLYGPGTRAFSLLLETPSQIAPALRDLESLSEFQSLFRVGHVAHDHVKKTTEPKSIEHIKTVVFDSAKT